MEIPVAAEPEGEEFDTSCGCCGRPIYHGHGWLTSEGRSLAAYWYQWSEGHEGRFFLAIARFDDEDCLIPGVATFSGSIAEGETRYSTVDPPDAPWDPLLTKSFGPMLTRDLALAHRGEFFAFVDAITANDQRLSSRILRCGLQA